MIYTIVIILLVILDQIVKFLVRANIPVGGHVSFLPGIMDLTYVQNTGAAFSSFTGQTFFLGLFSVFVSAALIIVLVKKLVRHPFGRWPVALILAGAVGNLIDRFLLGYVTDMFETLFINFAVFNVADICVVVGVIAFMLFVIFGWDKLEKAPAAAEASEEKKSDESAPAPEDAPGSAPSEGTPEEAPEAEEQP